MAKMCACLQLRAVLLPDQAVTCLQVDILVNNAGLALGKSGLQGTSLEVLMHHSMLTSDVVK